MRWKRAALGMLGLCLAAALVAIVATRWIRDSLVPPPGPTMSAATTAQAVAPDASTADASAPSAPPLPAAFDGVRWGPGGHWLATWGRCACSKDSRFEEGPPGACTVRLWDLRRGRIAQRIETPCAKRLMAVGWSPDGTLLAISDTDTLRVWRLADGVRLGESEPLASAGMFQWSPDGALLLWGNLYGTALLMRASPFKVVRKAQVLPLGRDGDWNATWSPDGRLLAVSAELGPFHIWDGKTGAILRELRVAGVTPLNAIHYDWLPDNRRIVFASDEGLLALGDAQTAVVKVLRRPSIEGRAPRQTSLSLDETSSLVLVNNGDGPLEQWDLSTGKVREILPARPSSWTSAVDPSPDGRHLAVMREDQLEIVPIDAPNRGHRVALGPSPTPFQMLGWAGATRYYAQREATLMAFAPDGSESLRVPLGDPEASVSLSPHDRYAMIVGQDITLVRLRDQRRITLRELGVGADGAVEGATGEAELAGFFDEAP